MTLDVKNTPLNYSLARKSFPAYTLFYMVRRLNCQSKRFDERIESNNNNNLNIELNHVDVC